MQAYNSRADRYNVSRRYDYISSQKNLRAQDRAYGQWRDRHHIAQTIPQEKKLKFFENLRFEDLIFEDQFEVYTNNKAEARTIFSADVRQSFLGLAKNFGDQNVECSFFDDRCLIHMAGACEFFKKYSAHEPIDVLRDFKTIVEKMSIVFDAVDTLKLDQHGLMDNLTTDITPPPIPPQTTPPPIPPQDP